jgi:cytochrome c-type biogenesis protein CcmE
VKAKHQRLTLALAALAAIVGAGVLAASALGEQAAYFYSPADVAREGVPVGRAVRLGGMVETGSLRRSDDGVTILFTVEDGPAKTPVEFRGVTPDLFKEASGVVAEGRFRADGTFIAENLLAKHDERYMPPQLEGGKHKTETLDP